MHRTKQLVLLVLALFFACLISSDADITITPEEIAGAEKIMGLSFTPQERDSLEKDLVNQWKDYKRIRDIDIPNSTPPALIFNPIPVGFQIPDQPSSFKMSPASKTDLPEKRVNFFIEQVHCRPGKFSSLSHDHMGRYNKVPHSYGFSKKLVCRKRQ